MEELLQIFFVTPTVTLVRCGCPSHEIVWQWAVKSLVVTSAFFLV
jgi:hypothetical protein